MQAETTWNLWNNLSICLKTHGNQESLYQDGRSQDIPYAH